MTTKLLQIALYGDCKFKDNVNKWIFITTIQFIKNSNRYNKSLLQRAKQQKNYIQPSVTFLVHFSGLQFYFILLSFCEYVCIPYYCIETLRKSFWYCLGFILFLYFSVFYKIVSCVIVLQKQKSFWIMRPVTCKKYYIFHFPLRFSSNSFISRNDTLFILSRS